jgi:hypothetical protein
MLPYRAHLNASLVLLARSLLPSRLHASNVLPALPLTMEPLLADRADRVSSVQLPALACARFVLEAHSRTPLMVSHATFVHRAFTLHPVHLIALGVMQEHSAALRQAVRHVLLAPQTLYLTQVQSLAHPVPSVGSRCLAPLHVQS